MDFLRLAIALLLPWLTGYLWLAAVQRWLGSGRLNTAMQIGYGLFLGYAALHGVLLGCNTVLDSITFLPVLLVMIVLCLAGAVVFSRTRASSEPHPAATADSRLAQILFWLLVGWAGLHLVLVAIEILHRPVFPWDAWLNWMYRAKAWYYSGQVLVMDSPGQWLQGTGTAPYNVAGNHYPTFVPLLALWAATALGSWSETLVNLPVLFCGIALGLGLYGQCREYGLEKLPSALGAYLLLSIPLVGAHLSLAGQADIWMAGFVGLGLVALLIGIICNQRVQLLLGLAMVAMGIAIKIEGAVWLVATVLILALATRPRATAAALVAVAALATLGWLVGVTHLDLPLLGKLGVAGGRLHIPLLGSYTLQSFELWDDYRDNFLNSGTWHLLWIFILLGAASLKFLPAGILRRTLVVFYIVLLAAQLFIFEGTEQGKWAEDWTAINRLPLHFAPALVFALVLLAHAFLRREPEDSRAGIALAVPLLSLVITLGGAITYLVLAFPAAGGATQEFTARQLRIVVGGGRLDGNIGIIDQYRNNVAIVTSGPVEVDTQQLSLVRVDTAGANQNRATFFWRNGSGPDDLHSTEISGRGIRWINLADLPEWQGNVSEIGIIFYADGDRPAEFRQLELLPHSLESHLRKLGQDWRETATWSQKSVHWLPAGAVATTVPLPLLMAAWVLLAMLVAVLLARRAPGALPWAGLCALAAWLVLDVRWTANSLAQAEATLAAYPLVSAAYLDFGDDQFTFQLVAAARSQLQQPGKRAIIMAEDETMRFQMLRAKYHALPAAVYVHEGPVQRAPAAIADYLLVLKKRYAEPGFKHATAADYARIISRRQHLRATPAWDQEEGFLVVIKPGSPPAEPAR